MSSIPIVVVEKENRYSISVLLGYLLRYLRREGLEKHFRFILTDWASAPGVLASLGEPHTLLSSLLTTQIPYLYNRILDTLEVSRRMGRISVAGGPHATGDPYGTILNIGFDLVFTGEAEECFANFLRELTLGGDPLSVCGVTTLSKGGVIARYDKRRIMNLDLIPPFCRKLCLFNSIEIMRRCPHACRYCQVSYIFGISPRFRSIESIVSFAKELLYRGTRDIGFISPNGFQYMCHRGLNLTALAELLETLGREIRGLGGRVYLGTFPSEVRLECVTEETLRIVRSYVDNKKLNIGAQTGSDRLLKLLHREHTADDVLNAVLTASKYGFSADVDYMFGLPWEEYEDLELTIKHIDEVIELGGRIHCHAFTPPENTPFFCFSKSYPGVYKK